MTAPNLKNPITIIGKTARSGIGTTTAVGIVTNAPGSNKALKINSIFCANVDGTNSADISVSIYNGSTDFYLAKTVNVPSDATQIISTKETYFYLEEGDSIRAIASATTRLELVIGYEEIS
tara:strand:- start:1181 stop:1543 length:363 start_codon:yes stop_codon:yes gene_type:complete